MRTQGGLLQLPPQSEHGFQLLLLILSHRPAGVLEHRNCSILCVRGCACAPGYSRLSPGGPCVRPDQCPIGSPAPAPTCPGPHQIYTACPSPCPITCANLKNPPTACPAICGDRHCVCVPGYLAVQENPLKCVRIDECPGHESSRCRGRHQTYTTCKPRCPATCASNATRICLAGCAGEGCVCKTRLRHPQRKSFDVRTSPRLSSQAHDVHRSRSSVHDVQITLPALVLGQWTSSMHGRLRWSGLRVQARLCAVASQTFSLRPARQVSLSPIAVFRRKIRFIRVAGHPALRLALHFGVPRVCGNKCAGEGCVCKEGFVMLKERPLKCVRPDQCISDCGKMCSDKPGVLAMQISVSRDMRRTRTSQMHQGMCWCWMCLQTRLCTAVRATAFVRPSRPVSSEARTVH
nr:uncharacterized protein LOC119164235 [Rhipicephalus microplus]